MSTAETKKHEQILYDEKFDVSFLQQNIQLPDNKADIPNIIGWSGPARSGTTALLFLLAGCPQIDRIYFQPQKTLLRFGYPSIKIHSTDKLICMKEAFFSSKGNGAHDPIEVLLRAGVPPEKITWITMLRDPLQTFSSWENGDIIVMKQDPEVFAFWQSHTVNLWHKYKDSNVKIVPFVYELLQGQEEYVLRKLLSKLGLNIDASSLELEFNRATIDRKLVPGQAADEEYFNINLRSILNRGRYMYTTNSYPIDTYDARRLTTLCQKQYEMFLEESKRALEL